MVHGHRGSGFFIAAVALIVGACGANTPTATPKPAPTPTPITAPAAPTPSPDPSSLVLATEAPASTTTAPPAPTATPAAPAEPTLADPKPTPKPTPAPGPGWTNPKRVGKVAGCNTISAGIDVASRYHVAAECAGTISSFVADPGGSWTTTVFAHPANRQDLDPQIAFQGNVVYVAYSQIAPDGACGGGRGLAVGVFIRSRSQPNGAWSAPLRIGSPYDSLQAFRVDGGTFHATVAGGYYETLKGSTYHRYRIPGAIGQTSLRIGSDGRARIAYEAAGGIRYAVFTGAGFSTSPVAGSSEGDLDPILALDANDRPHLLWTRTTAGACGDIPVGTYYATKTHLDWATHRITRAVGQTSLQVDPTTGRVHVLLGTASEIRYYTIAANAQWTRADVLSTPGALSPLIRVDPATGTLLVVYIRESASGSGTIYAMTRP